MLGIKLHLDNNSSIQMFKQLADQLRESIVRGDLQAGAKLALHRQLAKMLGVSRKVVRNLYRLLVLDDFVDSVVGSGTHVSRGRLNLIRSSESCIR